MIPYIGGRKNPFTQTLVKAASLLALYRVVKPLGMTPAEFGTLADETAQVWVGRYPGWLRWLLGRLMVSRWFRQRTATMAAVSQKSVYESDFEYEVVNGDGHTFDWGINFSRCGIVYFFAQQGATELSPYMCALDQRTFPAMGLGLQRTGTIARGSAHCDFRLKLGGPTRDYWQA